MAIEAGSYVEVVDREPTPVDQKAGLFYNHFRSLRGVVDRIYADGNLCVVVDHGSLTREMLLRLKRAERVIKPRWKTADSPDADEEIADAAAEEPADSARSSDEDSEDGVEVEVEEEETEGIVEGIGMASAGSRAAASAAALLAAAEDAGELKVNPGLRYSIVIKPEDVREVAGGARSSSAAVGVPRPEPAPARATSEGLRAAEARHMEELQSRAQKS